MNARDCLKTGSPSVVPIVIVLSLKTPDKPASPPKRRAAHSSILPKSATSECGFFARVVPRRIGTKYTLFFCIILPMFSRFALIASFVARAISIGRPCLECAFAAIVTAVSVIPCASFSDRVARASSGARRVQPSALRSRAAPPSLSCGLSLCLLYALSCRLCQPPCRSACRSSPRSRSLSASYLVSRRT